MAKEQLVVEAVLAPVETVIEDSVQAEVVAPNKPVRVTEVNGTVIEDY